MLTIAWLLISSAAWLQVNPPVVLGRVERDLTGDGKPEILQLVGTGPVENLTPVFTIQSAGKTIYRYELIPLGLTEGFDGGKRKISLERHKQRLKEFGPWFFEPSKFQTPPEFLDRLRVEGRSHIPEIPKVISNDSQPSERRTGEEIWEEIVTSRVTIFTFSPGGDLIVPIGWSERAGRFYRLMDCC